MRVAEFDFELPPDRIALRPAVPRDAARMLVVGEALRDQHVRDLPSVLRKGDVLVFNNTKVVPSALSGVRFGRHGTTPKIDVLLHLREAANIWRAFAKPAKKLEAGDRVVFGALEAVVSSKGEQGEIILTFALEGTALDAAIAKVGRMPLPPYIESKRAQDTQDAADYQTVFAARDGAVAAPTASLHFTHDLLKRLKDIGIEQEFVTLHVGAGTFLPMKAEDTVDHKMHAEWGDIPAEVAGRLRIAKSEGRRIIPVGTTALRLLETSRLEAFTGFTDIFITPGHEFCAADALMTNFHLPRSTLFALIAAFAGLERMKVAYAHAIAHDYRFYSYGDASLLMPAP